MKRGIFTVLLLTTSACSFAPEYVRPNPPIPLSWPEGDAYRTEHAATFYASRWQDVLRDVRLQRLITSALANNRDLRAAVANVVAARAQYRIQASNRLPRVTMGSDLLHSEGGVSGAARTSYALDVGATAFELDLFGRLASLANAEQERFLASQAGARSARLALIGTVADAWLSYGTDASLLQIASDTLANAQRSVELTNARLIGGVAPRSDLRQAEQILATAQADIARLRTALAQDANALRLLLGGTLDPQLLPGSIEDAEAAFAAPSAGMDSRILLHRPDVMQAEFGLRAADAEIGAARAAMFPTISLTSVLGFASNALSSLFSAGSFNWSGGANASYPLFRGGAGRAGVERSIGVRDAALAQYELAIQTAFKEAADALARRGTMEEQIRAVQLQVHAAADSQQLAEARYRNGIDTFLVNLDALRSLYSARISLTNIRQERAANLIMLFRVLGGDRGADEMEAAGGGE